MSRLTLKIKPYNDLRHALGLSSKAIVHEWSTVGVNLDNLFNSTFSSEKSLCRSMKNCCPIKTPWVLYNFSLNDIDFSQS
jgi:hypothetical protein